MKWRHLGYLQFLSRAVSIFTVVAEMEVSPQEEITNPQGMKVFTVERHGLLEKFVTFCTLCGVQSSPLVLFRIVGSSVVRYSGRHRGRLCVSSSRSPELSAQSRRQKSCTSCIPAQTNAAANDINAAALLRVSLHKARTYGEMFIEQQDK